MIRYSLIKGWLIVLGMAFSILQAACSAQAENIAESHRNGFETPESLQGLQEAFSSPENRNGNLEDPGYDTPQNMKLTTAKVMRSVHIRSPKSAIFRPDGRVFYVNALEGMKTLVCSADTLEILKVIEHRFGLEDQHLFFENETTLFDYQYQVPVSPSLRNCFGGKPVESAFSHGGRYLWVTYYRRDYDSRASSPSAVAIIDTQTEKIVRVMPTGPLAKMLVPSPDGKTMAIIHWGDNSIGLIDIQGQDPAEFHYKKLLVSGSRLQMKNLPPNRDSFCGQCLRGAAFTPDSRYLFVGKMHEGGITAFDMESGRNIGTLISVAHTPRHMVVSPDENTLYVSSNASGIVSALNIGKLIQTLERSEGKTTSAYRGRELFVGSGARTLAVSPDGKRLYVSCNRQSKIVCVDVASWKIAASAPVPPYAVGLAVSPSEKLIVVTSQGRQGKGGDTVTVYRTPF
ncbi:MAG: YncE family protein [Desulfovibrionaceae bacterium]|nr:YncE family protein [Desulfovibrionaceae bacterium]